MTDAATSPESTAAKAWQVLKVYLEPRVALILLLGFSAGVPLALSGSTLSWWMREVGVDLSTIGLFALVGTPYTIKFVWAPVVDAFRAPLLSRWLGRRRGWLLLSQIMLMAAIVFAGALDPVVSPWWMALAALLIAFSSATQDIVIDAFRVESLDNDQQAAGAANYVAAYRFGLLFSSAGTLGLVAWFESGLGLSTDVIWMYAYWIMAALILVGVLGVLISKEPAVSAKFEEKLASSGAESENLLKRLWDTAYHAFADFLRKPLAITILLFIIFFKLCDSFAGVMTTPFVVDLGFDRLDYVALVKGLGFGMTLFGCFVGGLMAKALPMVHCLWIAGLLQAGSNLVFAWLAWMGQSHFALGTAIAVENFTGGIGTVVFLAYVANQLNSELHTATQYALLTSLTAVGRTFISAASGFVAETTGWYWFFLISVMAAIPGFLFLAWLQAKGHFKDSEAGEASGVKTDGVPA